MAIVKGVGDFFGLDVSMTAVRVVQLSGDGSGKWAVKHFGQAPIDIKTATGDSAEAKRRLGEVIMTVVGQSGIKTKNVAISLPASKTFITVVDLPTMSESELRGTIKYQVDEYIPTSPGETKVDWVSLGQSLHDPAQQEVLLASVPEAYAEAQLDFIEGLGFDVVAAEPEALALIRSSSTAGKSAQVLVDIGESGTTVAIVYADAPRLVRTIPSGLGTMVRAAVQHLSVQEDQARQFILKFGLAPDKLEGQVARALESTLDGFASELTKSVKFFQSRYPSLTVGDIVLSGYAATVPQLGEYIESKVNMRVQRANPWQNVAVQNVAGLDIEYAIAIGLAQRKADV